MPCPICDGLDTVKLESQPKQYSVLLTLAEINEIRAGLSCSIDESFCDDEELATALYRRFRAMFQNPSDPTCNCEPSAGCSSTS